MSMSMRLLEMVFFKEPIKLQSTTAIVRLQLKIKSTALEINSMYVFVAKVKLA